MKRLLPALLLPALSSCQQDLYTVELQLVLAEALAGSLADADVDVVHRTIDEAGTENGGSESPQRFSFPRSASVRFEVVLTRDDEDGLALIGGGSSPLQSAPADGGSLAVPMLVAPVSAAGLLSQTPQALGGDACVADDGQGAVFLTGGSTSQQGAYVIDPTFNVRGLAAGFPTGVGGVGCAAKGGVLAVAGSCVPGVPVFIVRVDANGRREQVLVEGSPEACGAAAAPMSDGRFWLVDGDNIAHVVQANGARTFVGVVGAGSRGDIAITPKDGLVVIVGGALAYITADTLEVTNLGPAIAVGRHGVEVLVLDDDGVISAVEDATLVPVRADLGARAGVRSFVMLDDDTAVFLAGNGATVEAVASDGTARTLQTGATGATRVAALPGGTLVIAGHNGNGVQVLSLVD